MRVLLCPWRSHGVCGVGVVVRVALQLEHEGVGQPGGRVPCVAQAGRLVAKLDRQRHVIAQLPPLEAVVLEVVDRLEEQHRHDRLNAEEEAGAPAEARAERARDRGGGAEEMEQLVGRVEEGLAGLLKPARLEVRGGLELAQDDTRQELVERLTRARSGSALAIVSGNCV